MQQVPAQSQFEMGLSSIASILSNISAQTEQGNQFVNQISGNLQTFIADVKQPFLSIYNRSVTYQDKMLDITERQFDKISGIYEAMSNYINGSNNPQAPQTGNNVLNTISKTIIDILKHLQTKSTTTNTAASVSSSGGFFDGIGTFASSLVLIKKSLTNALIKNLAKFSDAYHKLTEKNSNDNAKAFTENIGKLSESIDDLSKRLKEPVKFIALLAVSFALLQLAVINPLFGVMVLGISAFIYILTKITSDRQFNPGMKDFATGIATLALSLIVMDYVNWESIGKMIIFIGALGIAMRTYKAQTGSDKSLIYLAGGISALVLASITIGFVSWESLGKMIIFITGLGLALKYMNGPRGMGADIRTSPMIIFATGIAILTLTMFAMTELPWEGIFKMVIFIGLLGLTMKLFNFNRMGPANSMIQFSFGIAVLVLAMYAIDELPWETVFKMIVFIGALGLTIRLMNGRGVPPLLQFAFGLSVMVLAMYAMDELPWEAIFKTILFLGALGLVLKLYGTTSPLLMIGIGAGIGILVLSLKYFKDSKFNMMDALNLMVAIGGIAGILAIIGIPAVAALVGLGSLALVGMSIALLTAGTGFKAIDNLSIDLDNIINFFKGVSYVAIGFAGLAIFMIPGLLGATLFIPIGVAALLGALSLSLIGKIEYNNGSIEQFIQAMKTVSNGFADNALTMIPAALAAVLFLPIAISALLGAGTLLAISNVKLDPAKLDNYNLQVKTLIDNINSFGIIEMGKAGIKALALIPIFTAGYLGAALLQKISEVNISKEKLGMFGQMMTYMVDTILTSLGNNESKMEAAKPGLEALAKLLSVSKGLAETIQMMANLKFYEYGVENGKLVLKGVRQLTTNDFKMVGVNLGTMLETLIAPLTILGSNSDMITIGGKTFANPFKNNATLAGIEVLARMGNAYKPMAESIKTLASSGVMTDPVLTKRFTDSLMSITAVYLWIFQKLAKIDSSLISSSIGQITRFNNGFKNLPTEQIQSLDTMFGRFINNLSDDIKWKKLRSNLRFMRMEFEAITKSMNTLNIEKATLFEKNIRNLIEKNNGQGLKEAAESLKQLLDLVETNQGGGGNGFVQPSNPFSNPFAPTTNVATPAVATNKKNSDNNTSLSEDAITQLIAVLDNVKQILSGIDTKLGNTLKVKMVTGAGNQI